MRLSAAGGKRSPCSAGSIVIGRLWRTVHRPPRCGAERACTDPHPTRRGNGCGRTAIERRRRCDRPGPGIDSRYHPGYWLATHTTVRPKRPTPVHSSPTVAVTLAVRASIRDSVESSVFATQTLPPATASAAGLPTRGCEDIRPRVDFADGPSCESATQIAVRVTAIAAGLTESVNVCRRPPDAGSSSSSDRSVSSATHKAPRPETSAVSRPPPRPMVWVMVPVAGSICVTLPPGTLATHTDLPLTAIAPGVPPTGIDRRACPVDASIRSTTPSPGSARSSRSLVRC